VGVDVGERLDLGQDLRAAVGDGDPNVTVPDVDTGNAPGGKASATKAGPPATALGGVPRSSVSTSPASSSSLTRLDTVVRDRPDPRARSARLWGPRAERW
jgi:hypothetical protein